MTKENDKSEPLTKEKRIHHWTFAVEKKIPHSNIDPNNGYEWLKKENGKWVRIPKKTDKLIEKVQS